MSLEPKIPDSVHHSTGLKDAQQTSMIPVFDLKPGMILAQNVYARNGRFLMSQNTELHPEHLQVLKVWGVTEAEILGDCQDLLQENLHKEHDPEKLAQAEACLQQRFRHVDLEHPAMKELFRLTLKRKAAACSGCTEPPGQAAAQASSRPEPASRTVFVSTAPDLQLVIENIDQLPSLPDLFFELQEAIDSSTCDADRLARIISRDPSLAARLLRLVNSAFYGFPSRIDSISRAVVIVGTKKLSMLAMATTILQHFRHIPEGMMNMHLFWKHSVATGIACRTIAGLTGAANTERFFVAGLLHDLGRLMLYDRFPQASRQGLMAAEEKQQLLWVTENELLGYDHARIGGMILEKWQMPEILVSSVSLHQQPGMVNNELCPAAVHTADLLINALEIGSSGERYVPDLDRHSWELLGLGIGCFSMLLAQLDRILAEILQSIFPDQA